jgi:hypothetical protein
MPDTTVLKVAIVEDLPRIREGLRTLIDGTDGFRKTPHKWVGYVSRFRRMLRDRAD